ncbi:MAG: cysteine desulfurase family protein [Waddliaceae bacterium]
MIYLDNNSATPLDPRVITEIVNALKQLYGNPSSIHSKGRESKAAITKARDLIAMQLGVRSDEIIFTSGGTEGINLVLRGMAERKGGHFILSNVEHAALEQTVQALEKKGVIEAKRLSVGTKGALEYKTIENAICPNTQLIACAAVNNETGVKTNIEAIARLALSRGIDFFVDGVALLGKESFVIPEGVSAMSFSGQKIHGPKGIGFLFVRKQFRLNSQITGGTQEYGRRAGTEAVPLIVGLAKAVELLGDFDSITSLRDLFESELKAHSVKFAVNGEGERVCSTSNLAFEGVDVESLLMHLDIHGIAASHGSACQSGNFAPSRVLLNMGYPPERVNSSIRFSFSRMNTKEEVKKAAKVISDLIRPLSSLR